MAPRRPRKTSNDEVQKNRLQAVHEALNLTTPVEDQVITDAIQTTPPQNDAAEPAAVDTKVEIDRIEEYLRGPTAFTA